MAGNIPTVQKIYQCFGAGDVPGILALFDDDIDWEHDWGIPPLPLFQPRRGRQNVTGFFEHLQGYEIHRFEPLNFLEGGDQVAAIVRLEFTVKATGKTAKDLETHLWTFGQNGKVARMRHFSDTRQLERVMS